MLGVSGHDIPVPRGNAGCALGNLAPFLGIEQLLLLLGDIDASADISGESAVGNEARGTALEHPAVLAVLPLKPVVGFVRHPNKLNRYSLGTKSKSMKKNPDGSLTLYFQGDSPGVDKESNWVPAPTEDFSLYIRS